MENVIKIQQEFGSEIKIEELLGNPVKMLEFLVERITQSNSSLPEIFQAFDLNGDGVIDFKEFVEGIGSTGIKFPIEILEQVFKRFDFNEGGSISYVEFLSTLFGDESKKKDFLNYMLKAEENFDKLRKIIHSKFSNFDEMYKKMNCQFPQKLTMKEFKTFCSQITDLFSRIELTDIFNILDKESKGFLNMLEIKKLYAKQNLVSVIQPEPEKMKKFVEEKEAVKAVEEPRKLKIEIQRTSTFDGSSPTKSETKRLSGIKNLGHKNNWSRSDDNLMKKAEILEHFMVDFSNSTLDNLKKEGKNLKDIFDIFAKETLGYLNHNEFNAICRMILEDSDIPFSLTNNFFNIFVYAYPKKMSFEIFSNIIYIGKKANSIYIKCKQKFKECKL